MSTIIHSMTIEGEVIMPMQPSIKEGESNRWDAIPEWERPSIVFGWCKHCGSLAMTLVYPSSEVGVCLPCVVEMFQARGTEI